MQKVMIYGSSIISSSKSFSLFKKEIITAKDNGKIKKLVNLKDEGFKNLVDISWLPFASKKYCISSSIDDYVVTPVGIVTSDIPNRNSQCFSMASLVEFDVNQKVQRYKTFVGAPTFEEHRNSDETKAKGVNLDANLTNVPYYKIAKVNVLAAFDRTKDRSLALDILKGEKNAYSMGALCGIFQCSICGGVLGPSIKRTCSCKGNFDNLKEYGSIVKGKLHYIFAVDPVFVELSSVADAADTTAIGEVFS
jgi:hypothetical protein